MSHQPVCPAARPLAGPPGPGPAVICGVALHDKGLADEILHGTYLPGLITSARDSRTYYGFCCGTGLPVMEEPEHGRAHYTACPIWRARREADWERRELTEEPKRRGIKVDHGIG